MDGGDWLIVLGLALASAALYGWFGWEATALFAGVVLFAAGMGTAWAKGQRERIARR